MKHSGIDEYIKAVEAWDKSHRIVGKESFRDLLSQSIEALSSFMKDNPSVDCLVDVGAGSGLLGFPALYLFPTIKVVFVEPDLKKAAFLVQFLSGAGPRLKERALVQPLTIESVSRETLAKFAGSENIALLARAFSGSRLLNDSIRLSKLSNYPVFTFKAEENRQESAKYFFEPLKIS